MYSIQTLVLLIYLALAPYGDDFFHERKELWNLPDVTLLFLLNVAIAKTETKSNHF